MKKERCKALNKDGVRQGMPCSKFAVADELCRVHNPKLINQLKKDLIKAKEERKELMESWK